MLGKQTMDVKFKFIFWTFEVRLQLFEFYSKFENGRGGRETTHNGRRLSYISSSPSRWSTPDQVAITNGSQPTSSPQPTSAASVQQLTQKTTTSPNDCITLCRILWYGRRAWGAVMGGVDRPRRVRITAETIANRFWVPSNYCELP